MSSRLKPKIYFFFQTSIALRQRTKLKEFIESIFKKEKKKLSALNYVFCTDDQLLEINQQYLAHDFYTDILTFELSPNNLPVEGEIYISVDRVRENALALKESLYMELHRVIFHGALHLCGYRDKNKKEIKKMRQMENNCLQIYFKVPRDTVS